MVCVDTRFVGADEVEAMLVGLSQRRDEHMMQKAIPGWKPKGKQKRTEDQEMRAGVQLKEYPWLSLTHTHPFFYRYSFYLSKIHTRGARGRHW